MGCCDRHLYLCREARVETRCVRNICLLSGRSRKTPHTKAESYVMIARRFCNVATRTYFLSMLCLFMQASFKSIEAELTLEELPPTGIVATSCDRMLEEIGIPHSSPSEGDTRGALNGGNCSGGGGGSGGGGENDDPTWTREGLGGCPMKRTTTKGGERQSAWAAFIKPVTAMPNLRIKDDATVSRVIFEGGRAVGVEILESTPSWRGARTRVRELRLAKQTAEIILCCGVFRTPKLLMLSGIGPREHLEEKGVPVVIDMPHVRNWRRFASPTVG